MSDISGSLPATLTALGRRIGDGIMPAVRDRRPTDWAAADSHVLRDTDLWQHLACVDDLRTSDWPGPAGVNAVLTSLAEWLAANRPALLATLFSPELLLAEAAKATPGDGRDAIDIWVRLGLVVEAASSAVQSDAATAAPYAPGDQELLLPVAARLRFLVLTEPLRHDHDTGWPPPDPNFNGNLAGRIFGMGSAHLLAGRLGEARDDWQRHLDEYQSRPLLALATPQQFEWEVSMLGFCRPRRLWPGRPLALDKNTSHTGRRSLGARDDVLLDDVAEQHLLPRFRLGQVAILASTGTTRVRGRAAAMVTLLVIAAGLTCGVLAGHGRFDAACVAAAACYLLIGLGTAACGRRWAMQWLLRLPAAGTVGLFVLLTLPATWWLGPATATTAARAYAGWPGIVVLAIASYGYLVVEARNHGTSGWAALVRGLVVAAVAATHALLICLIGLILVAPPYVDDGATLTNLWTPGHATAAWAVLTRAVAWCMSVGVFSQVLWDDRPITAPLAHLQWRRRE